VVNASLTDLSLSPAGAWLAVSSSGSGTITISTLEQARATGTFSFTLISTTGRPNKAVTNGTFDVSF
jgi:hypothetical protein